MLLLEINEFSPDLMAEAAEIVDGKNLKKLLSFKKSATTTDDKKERYGLDPWVQWVSIHTGKKSDQHSVQHLGDVPNLSDPQIWETLDKTGISTGIWGAMNASKGTTNNCKFFFPDPWTFSEKAFPDQLNNLLAFPRYYSKNYGDIDQRIAIKHFMKLIGFCLYPKISIELLPLLPTMVKYFFKDGVKAYMLFALFDLVNAKLFCHFYKEHKPEFSILFLNSLAHLQHHKWTSTNPLSKEMRLTFKIFDQALGIIFKTINPNTSIVAANAFTQQCTYNNEEYLYRQINPEQFLKTIEIEYMSVEQLMTNDGHVFFETESDAKNAANILKNATVDGSTVFHVDYDSSNRKKLFYQVSLWKKIEDNAMLEVNSKRIPFFSQFDVITRRSGSHIPDGHVFSSHINFPESFYNNELYDHIVEYYKPRT